MKSVDVDREEVPWPPSSVQYPLPRVRDRVPEIVHPSDQLSLQLTYLDHGIGEKRRNIEGSLLTRDTHRASFESGSGKDSQRKWLNSVLSSQPSRGEYISKTDFETLKSRRIYEGVEYARRKERSRETMLRIDRGELTDPFAYGKFGEQGRPWEQIRKWVPSWHTEIVRGTRTKSSGVHKSRVWGSLRSQCEEVRKNLDGETSRMSTQQELYPANYPTSHIGSKKNAGINSKGGENKSKNVQSDSMKPTKTLTHHKNINQKDRVSLVKGIASLNSGQTQKRTRFDSIEGHPEKPEQSNNYSENTRVSQVATETQKTYENVLKNTFGAPPAKSLPKYAFYEGQNCDNLNKMALNQASIAKKLRRENPISSTSLNDLSFLPSKPIFAFNYHQRPPGEKSLGSTCLSVNYS